MPIAREASPDVRPTPAAAPAATSAVTSVAAPAATSADTSAAAPGDVPSRLLTRQHLPVVAGTVALVTLGAFENRAVMTILPTVVRELDGWGLFGAAAGAPLVTFTIAMAWAGGWTDRRGPRPALLAGLAAFALAQVVSGLAPTMGVFVAGRVLSGAAEALIGTALVVLVAQVLPEALRAKVFAAFAAAWVLPSLLGPSVAAGLDAVGGWRAVFVAPLVIVPLALLPVRRALRDTHPGLGGDAGPDAADRRRVRASLVLAAGLAVTLVAATLLAAPGTRPAGALALAAGVVGVLVGAARALPAGTARLVPGIPAIVTMQLLVSAAYTGVGGVIPLMLVQTRGASTAQAGISLSVTGVFWAAGSWVNGTGRAQRVPAAARVRLGGGLIAAGALGPVLISLDVVGLAAGMAGWSLAGLGMGIVSPTITTELLAQSPPEGHGRISAAQGLAVSTGVALQTALVAAVVAVRGDDLGGPAFAALMTVGALAATGVALVAGRSRGAA
jgi:MFS family permease